MRLQTLCIALSTVALAASCGKKKDDSSGKSTASGDSTDKKGSGSGDAPAPAGKGSVKASLAPGGSGHDFTPSKEGFKFQNYGNEDGIENLTPKELVRLFGDQVCAEKDGDNCVLTPVAERWMTEINKGMNGGHCEGFAALSLLFTLGKAKPDDFGAKSVFELELKDNKALQHEIAYWFSTQFIAPMKTAEIKTMTPNEIVDKLTEAFKDNKDSYTIGIYMADWTGGHATTPYAIVDKGDDKVWIMHYDNNFPGEERHIEVDRKKNTWSYFTASNPKEPGAAYEGSAETKTLTIAPTSVRIGKLECPFCGDVDKETEADGAKGSRQIISDGDADLLVTDDSGKRVGKVNGKIVNEISGSEVVEFKSNATLRAVHEPVYSLPNGHKLTVTLDGSTLKKKEDNDVALVGPGYTMGVYGVNLSPGEKDTIEIAKDWSEISYKTDQDETPEIEIGIETSGADYEMSVHAAGESGGQRIDLALDIKTGTFTVQAAAKDGEAGYEVEVRRIDDKGVQTFKHKGVSSGAADKLVFHYADWKGQGQPMAAGHDKGGDGSIDETEQLGDED